MLNTTKNQLSFIAELNGFKTGTPEEKVNFGLSCYANRKLLDLDLTKEVERKEAYENIWLERIYDELDSVHEVNEPMARRVVLALETISDNVLWEVPIELDASASLLQYVGALLGSKSLLSMTNCIVEDNLTDPWGTVEDVSRLAVKTVMTPKLYGSSQSAVDLLNNKEEFKEGNVEELARKIMSSHEFSLADKFKEFVLKHVVPKEEMEVAIWEETFTIKCNHFKQVGEYTKFYKAYDTKQGKEVMFRNVHTKQVPDLKRFNRFFLTLLIHHLDSRVANVVSEKLSDKYGWVIPIHDALIVPPQAANDCKNWYAEELTKIYQNRSRILTNYFKSIGITGKATTDWEKLVKQVDKVDNFKCSPYALK